MNNHRVIKGLRSPQFWHELNSDHGTSPRSQDLSLGLWTWASRCNELLALPASFKAKKTIDTSKSDRELFEELPLDDVWEDAKLADVYFYLRASKKTQIPNTWVQVFEELDTQLASYRDASHSWTLGCVHIGYLSTDEWVSHGWNPNLMETMTYRSQTIKKHQKKRTQKSRKSTQISRKSTKKPAKVNKSGFLTCGHFQNIA